MSRIGNDNSFGEYLEDLRNSVGLSVEELASKLNIDQISTVNWWEEGMLLPPYGMIGKLAEIYEIREEELRDIFAVEFRKANLGQST